MFIKKPTHKKFEYIPRFYKPEKDSEERRKRKLGFRHFRKYSQKGTSSILIWLISIFIILWFIIKYLK
jgi:hypothetical protein